jgi:ATP:cob(I)alamin adenosyltransferase
LIPTRAPGSNSSPSSSSSRPLFLPVVAAAAAAAAQAPHRPFAAMADDGAGGGGSKFRIYTRTGDKGESSLYTGDRLAKDAAFFQALGDVDELNSAIGMACALLADQGQALGVKGGKGGAAGAAEEATKEASTSIPPLAQQLAELQSRLLDTGSAIATPQTSGKAGAGAKPARAAFAAARECTERLESWIDAMDAELPPLRNFILPSGGPAASALHVARSVCRRAERASVPLWRDGALDADVLAFLNRLSDYLFTAARFVAMREGHVETVYKKGA